MKNKEYFDTCIILNEVYKPIHGIYYKDGSETYADFELIDGIVSYECYNEDEFKMLAESFDENDSILDYEDDSIFNYEKEIYL